MIARTAPMGWNSWNTLGTNINEQVIKEIADTMIETGLKDAGYEYLCIDDCWSENERGQDGRLTADPEKFPNGMKAVADYVHSKGLKFGMYTSSGHRMCMGAAASYDYEFEDVDTFASWDVDLLKYDFCHRPAALSAEYTYRRMGAALASLISRAVACCAVLFLLQKPDCMLRITGLSALRPDGGLIRRILRVGIPAGIENGMFQIGKLSVASLTSTLGTAAIAANAVANTTSTFLNIPANAVSMAVLTVVGQCLGAGEKEQAVWYARRLLLVAYCGAWVMNLSGFFFADRWALSWFNLSPEASAMALEVMMWFNIVSLFFWPSSFTLPNILRSAGDASFTMAVSIVSMWVFRVGFCYLWVLRMGGGLLSIWMGMYLDWVFRSLCFAVRFVRGRWLEKTVI